MKRVRVIPIMLISEGRAVITRQFRDSIYVGDPINAIKIFNDKEVDEMVILDISTKNDKNKTPNYNLITKLASESFMPIAYGGNITSVNHANEIINCGVEKICINSGLFTHAEAVLEIIKRYGSQSVVASIDVKRNIFRKPIVKIGNGSKTVSMNIERCARYILSLGVGEIFLTSINNDGMACGYDYQLISEFKSFLNIPIVASGGASSIEDFRKAIEAGASAVAAGAIFYFKGGFNSVLINYPDQLMLKENLYQNI